MFLISTILLNSVTICILDCFVVHLQVKDSEAIVKLKKQKLKANAKSIDKSEKKNKEMKKQKTVKKEKHEKVKKKIPPPREASESEVGICRNKEVLAGFDLNGGLLAPDH